MRVSKVKVFNSNIREEDLQYYTDLGLDKQMLNICNNKILNSKGTIKVKGVPTFIPLEHNLILKDKYELVKDEQSALQMFKSSEKQASDMLDSCKRKRERFEKLMIELACQKLEIDVNDTYIGNVDCDFSPLNKCVYVDGKCIFCGGDE